MSRGRGPAHRRGSNSISEDFDSTGKPECKRHLMKKARPTASNALFVFLLSVSAIFVQAPSSAANDTVKWFRVDIPPVYMVDGGDRQGFGDLSMQFVMDRLGHYAHETVTTNMSRGLSMLESGDNVSFSTLLKNKEREEFVEFSVASQLVLPLHVVTAQEDAQLFSEHMDENGLVDFESVLADGRIAVGVASGRSYSVFLDDILMEFKDNDNLYERSSPNISAGLIDMIEAGRIDCTLEFPVTVERLRKENAIKDNEYTYLPIKGMPEFFVTHFAAPKNEWGAQLIREIDQILLQYRATDEFIGFYREWLDESLQAGYEAAAKKRFLELETR